MAQAGPNTIHMQLSPFILDGWILKSDTRLDGLRQLTIRFRSLCETQIGTVRAQSPNVEYLPAEYLLQIRRKGWWTLDLELYLSHRIQLGKLPKQRTTVLGI
jgi:hypothetical protein